MENSKLLKIYKKLKETEKLCYKAGLFPQHSWASGSLLNIQEIFINDKEFMKVFKEAGETMDAIETLNNGFTSTKQCCDNCELPEKDLCGKPLMQKGVGWDNSKDYCSKWEEKKEEDKRVQNYVYNEIEDMARHHTSMTEDTYKAVEICADSIIERFKQRIQESLDKAEECMGKSDILLLNIVRDELTWATGDKK